MCAAGTRHCEGPMLSHFDRASAVLAIPSAIPRVRLEAPIDISPLSPCQFLMTSPTSRWKAQSRQNLFDGLLFDAGHIAARDAQSLGNFFLRVAPLLAIQRKT